MIPRRKEPMANLIRELQLHNSHQDALVGGWALPSEPKPRYEIVTDNRQGGWFDPGYGVRDEQTGVLMNEIPFATTSKAQSFIDDLENPEGK